MSDTPRTDVNTFWAYDDCDLQIGVVEPDFARAMERELSAALSRADELEGSKNYYAQAYEDMRAERNAALTRAERAEADAVELARRLLQAEAKRDAARPE